MTAPNSPAWYDTSDPRSDTDTDTVRTPEVSGARGDGSPAAAPAVGTVRTVRAKVAAAIAVVAFLLGVGASMLTGPLLGGGPGGPGGPGDGGPGAPPGTSQQSTTDSGTTSS